MTDRFHTVGEYRLRHHLSVLEQAVNTAHPVAAPAAAADVLDALYALTRHWRDSLLGRQAYDAACRSSHGGRVVGGLTHLRGQAVHHAIVLSDITDRIAEHFYDHFGCWVWNPHAEGGGEPSAMYQGNVANVEVLTTVPAVQTFCFQQLPASLELIREAGDTAAPGRSEP